MRYQNTNSFAVFMFHPARLIGELQYRRRVHHHGCDDLFELGMHHTRVLGSVGLHLDVSDV